MSGDRGVTVGHDAYGNIILTGDGNTVVAPPAATPLLLPEKPVRLPYPSIGSWFKGRDAVLEELHTSLAAARGLRVTAIVGKTLHGLGGVGKTRLAVEYAHRYAGEYSALLFVAAETPGDLNRNLATLSGRVVPGPTEAEAPEEAVRLAAVLQWLRAKPGWLLILDNADSEAAAAAVEELLAELQGGDVLITSRLTQWGSIATRELDSLTREASTAFLLERTNGKRLAQPTDAEAAGALAERLDGLALALEQAGAAVAYRRISLAAYRREWEAHLPEVLGWYDERLMKYPRSVAVTWETTLRHLGAAEVALLRQLSFLVPEPIPLFLLE